MQPMLRTVTFVCVFLGPLLVGGHRGRRNDLISAGSSHAQALDEIWSSKEYKSPMQRVVALLEQMRTQLQAEADQESEMYDKMVCWCETNEKDKTAAVADADTKTNDLQTEIEERAARHGVLSTNIAAMKKQIAADQESLKTATAIREREAAEFSQEEKDMIQAITNLKNAVAVLSKHNGGSSSMIQLDAPVLASVRAVLRDVSEKYDLLSGDEMVGGPSKRSAPGAVLLTVGGAQKEGLNVALRREFDIHGASSGNALPLDIAEHMLSNYAGSAASATGAFVQSAGGQPAPFQSYAPRSGTIFGILNQMKDEFEANLSQAQKDEIAAREAFEELSKSKNAQISIAKEKLDGMETDFSDNQKALSDAKEDLDLTRKQRTADVEFLSNLRLTCQAQDHEWESRSATRAEELKAVNEALVILRDDDNRELMAKTVTMLQLKSISEADSQARRSRVAAFLRAASSAPELDTDDLLAAWQGRSESPKAQLATLAVSVELDSFTKVKEALDKMTSDLKSQQEEEVKSKAYCVEELATNEKITYTKTQEKADLEASMDTLAATIAKLKSETKSAQEQIAESRVEIKKAGGAREQENKEYQTVVADQRATQAILAKALARLQLFYKRGSKTSLLQRVQKQTPPEKFTKYKKNAGHSSVLGLIEQIVEDSKALEAEAIDGESKAQVAYESFVKNSNTVIAELEESVAANTKNEADATLESEQAAEDHASTVDQLESLSAYKADLHSQCNFLLKNFEIRQKARTQEMEAIQSAKAFLSGAAAGN